VYSVVEPLFAVALLVANNAVAPDAPDLYMFTLPVAFSEPDMSTAWFNWLTYDAVDANDADTAFNTYDAVCASVTNDAVCASVTNDAVCANDDVTAFDAHDAVPNNEPVMPFCTVKLPVIVAEPDNVMVRSEDTSNIADDPVYMVHSEPDTASVTSNNGPFDPLTMNGDEPDLYMFTLPVAFNEPEISTAWFNWLTYDAVDANEADTALSTYDAVCANVTNDAVAACVAYDAVPNNDPVNDVAVKLPVNPYEPVNCFELIHTLPDLTNISPYDVVVDVSSVSCISPSSYPLSIRTCMDPLFDC
jgi:hypothetical protein